MNLYQIGNSRDPTINWTGGAGRGPTCARARSRHERGRNLGRGLTGCPDRDEAAQGTRRERSDPSITDCLCSVTLDVHFLCCASYVRLTDGYLLIRERPNINKGIWDIEYELTYPALLL